MDRNRTDRNLRQHNPLAPARDRIAQIAESDLFRVLRYGRTDGAYVTIDGKKMINLCSNDYLALGNSSHNIAHEWTDDNMSQLQSSSRLLAGSDVLHRELEETLASHKSHDSALIYPTGYMTNIGVIPILAGKGDTIISDELNHASIIEGCHLAHGAKIITYKHNDPNDLESKIPDSRGSTIIITEGVFSMDGDVSPLRQISTIAAKNNSILVVDDAHGDFVLGDNGGGTPEHAGLTNSIRDVHVYISSLSKGLGSFGGYVASESAVTALCVNRSKPFIYTSALPSVLVSHALSRMRSTTMQQRCRRKLQKNVRLLSEALVKAGYPTESKTHIMPIMINDEGRANTIAKHLYKMGVYAPSIRYPTVPMGKARLRISATAWLSERDIQKIQHSLETVGSTTVG